VYGIPRVTPSTAVQLPILATTAYYCYSSSR